MSTIDVSGIDETKPEQGLAFTADVRSNTAAIKSQLVNAGQDIDATNINVANNAAGVSTNAGNISTNGGNIATNAGNISNNAGNIATNSGNISNNTGNISTNTTNISNNAASAANNATAISNLADGTTDHTDFNSTGEVAKSGQNLGGADLQAYAQEAAAPDMTVVVSPGRIWDGTALTSFAQLTTPAFTAPTTNPRIDRVAIDVATGLLVVVAGTEAASPTAPAYTAGQYPICQVSLIVSQTIILNADITDERPLVQNSPSNNIAGFVKSDTTFIESTFGSVEQAFDIGASITAGGGTETIGPTASTVDNVWTALDILPDNVKSIRVRISNYISGSSGGANYVSEIRTGNFGQVTLDDSRSLSSTARFLNRSGLSETAQSVSVVDIPVQSDTTTEKGRFDMRRLEAGTSPTVVSTMRLVGFDV